MYLIFFMFFIILLISVILMFMNFIMSKKMSEDREKKSSYECGFDSFESSRLPYSIHFFLISMIFLIFDIELSLLFPLILMFEIMNFSIWLVFILLMMIFFLGLWIEWIEGSLEWKK